MDKELLEVFLSEANKCLIHINEGCDRGDFKKIEFYAHKIEGAARMLGLEDVIRISHAMKDKAKIMDQSVLEYAIELADEVNQVKTRYGEV